MTKNIDKLGTYLDGWFDIVEEKAELTNQIREEILIQLKNIQMPSVFINKEEGKSALSTRYRPIIFVETHPGLTTFVNVSEFGNNLYISWRTFIKPVLNGLIISVILGIGFIYGVIAANMARDGHTQAFFGGLIGGAIFISILVAFAGFILKRDFLAFFLEEPTWFNIEDVSAMNLTIHKTILRAVDNNGIDVSKLRVKQEFAGGNKNIKG